MNSYLFWMFLWLVYLSFWGQKIPFSYENYDIWVGVTFVSSHIFAIFNFTDPYDWKPLLLIFFPPIVPLWIWAAIFSGKKSTPEKSVPESKQKVSKTGLFGAALGAAAYAKASRKTAHIYFENFGVGDRPIQSAHISRRSNGGHTITVTYTVQHPDGRVSTHQTGFQYDYSNKQSQTTAGHGSIICEWL